MPHEAPVPVTLRVTEIGEFVRHHSCARRLKLGQNEAQLRRSLPFYSRLFNALDPVLRVAGSEREDEAEEGLLEGGFKDLTNVRARRARGDDNIATPWDDFCGALARLGADERAYGREIEIECRISGFLVQGRVDFVLLDHIDGEPILRVIECKASRRDKTYQRIQAAAYHLILSRLLADRDLRVAGRRVRSETLQAAVARIDEGTERIQPLQQLPALALEMELADVRRLLAEGGQISTVLNTQLSSLSYEIDSKCDHCKFNVVCLPEAGRTAALELIGIDSSAARALRAAGVNALRELAALDLEGELASRVRATPGFSANLNLLKKQAQIRCTTLPGGGPDPDEYEVSRLPWHYTTQVPNYRPQGRPLVRVYLSVHYDYVENRVGALVAHVTSSEWALSTPFREVDGRYRPDPRIIERRRTGAHDANGRPVHEERAVEGARDICRYQSAPWSENHDAATGQEAGLLHQFFEDLINAIADIAQAPSAPVHFYVWSRGEVSQLIEACLRADSRMLRSLHELLGCREPLDQLIFSCIQEDIDHQFALGWTGRGLSVVTSLRWFGQRFHWTRTIAGQEVQLDRIFNQDIFDFKTRLATGADGGWSEDDAPGAQPHTFEIRSRFYDSLTAPYWRAKWGTLMRPETRGLDAQQANQLRRYYGSAGPSLLNAFLRSRAHALRWIESFLDKNDELEKPELRIADLQQFRLPVDSPAVAALDFLRLDHHVGMAEWIATRLVPPANRVARGITLPLTNLRATAVNVIEADIDSDRFGVDLETLRNKFTTLEFARLSPYSGEPERSQTIGQFLRGGITCTVSDIDWDQGTVRLETIFSGGSRYVLQSHGVRPGEPIFEFATLDESPSDYVSPRVDDRLTTHPIHACYGWFDPTNPVVPAIDPIAEPRMDAIEATLQRNILPNNRTLQPDQREAALCGLNSRVQLLQGPPGTGKTATAAVSIVARMMSRVQIGQYVLVTAHTHTAVDAIMNRLLATAGTMDGPARDALCPIPPMTLYRLEPRNDLPGITTIQSNNATRTLVGAARNTVVVIGGTTNALLKLARSLDGKAAFAANGFLAHQLIVDEASMMVFSNFLALTSLLDANGQILLAGDHRQLAPIVAHEWEEEERYPVTIYQPFVSAYEAIRRIKEVRAVPDAEVATSALRFSFRLPEIVRHLIAPVYQRDAIDLEGRVGGVEAAGILDPANPWTSVWAEPTGLLLVVHDEQESARANQFEAQIILSILSARREFEPASVVVMTPHRAQRSLLKRELRGRDEILMVETVEKMQGGECPVVIISATASDPSAINKSAAFILDLNRANVAFSRTQERLIVVCSRSLLDSVPADLEHYETALLWKAIRELCSNRIAEIPFAGHNVTVYVAERGLAEEAVH